MFSIKSMIVFLAKMVYSWGYRHNMTTKNGVIHSGVLLPDVVTIKGTNLVWGFNPFNRNYHCVTNKTLTDFAKLGRKNDPKAVHEYARDHGVLLATFAGNDRTYKDMQPEDTVLRLRDGTHWEFGQLTTVLYGRREPIELWLTLSRRLAAVLEIGAALKGRDRQPQPTPGPAENWNLLLSPGWTPTDVGSAQSIFHKEINWWLRLGGVRLQLGSYCRWATRPDWKLEVAYDGLIGGLAFQLLTVIVGHKLYACDGCHFPYIRDDRAPRPGQENFCPDCTKVAALRATQRYRERRKKEKGKQS